MLFNYSFLQLQNVFNETLSFAISPFVIRNSSLMGETKLWSCGSKTDSCTSKLLLNRNLQFDIKLQII